MRNRAGAWLGLASAATALGAAHLVAGLVGRAEASPIVAVGSASIDFVPRWLKDVAIDTFGTADKLVLVLVVTVVVGGLAIAVGTASLRRRGGLREPRAPRRDRSGGSHHAPERGADRCAPRGDGSGGRRGHAEVAPAPAPRGGGAGRGGDGSGLGSRLEAPLPGRGRRRVRRRGRGGGHRAVPLAALRGGGVSSPGVRANRGRGGSARAERGRTRRRRDDPLHHTERRLLPHRHRPDRAHGDRRGVAPARARHGRARAHAGLRSADGAPVDRARRHPRVRLERGRRRPDRQRPLDRGPARGPARRGRHRPRAPTQLVSTSDDGFTAGTPVAAVTDGRDAHARRRDERRAVADRARVPGAHGRARALRVRLGHEVGRRSRAHDVRCVRPVLDPARMGRAGADQDAVAHRHPGERRRCDPRGRS